MNNYEGKRFGHYCLTGFLGQGSFGDVYAGQDSRNGTKVAVKVLRTQLTNKDEIEQFINEAGVVGLRHPNIVKVLHFGTEYGVPYLVLEYAPNGTLRGRHRRGDILLLDIVIDYVEQIAQGLQYAHDQGLIHRDIKPENLLLNRKDRVLLSDFGTSIIVRSTNTQNTRQIAGTAPYIAPEQWKGEAVGFASDQYSLGIVVYEWLSGGCPFQGNLQEIGAQHLSARPPSLCQRNPAISPQVESVIMKTLAKKPSDRFDRVQLFAERLKEAWKQQTTHQIAAPSVPVAPQPSQGKRVGNPLMTRWSPTRRKVVAGIVAATAISVTGIGGIEWFLLSHRLHIRVPFEPNATPTPSDISTAVPATPSTLYKYVGHANSGAVFGLAWSPNEMRIASGGADRTVQVWSVSDGTQPLTYVGHQKTVTAVAWSPDGKHIASTSDDSTVQVWNATSGKLIWIFTGHVGDVHSVAWSPDGAYLASGSNDRTVRVWDTVGGSPTPVFVYRGHTSYVWDVAWSPDGKYIASGCSDHMVHVWKALTGDILQIYRNHSDELRGVAWASNESLIASCGLDRTAQVWDAFSGKIIRVYREHSGVLDHVAWSSDNMYIASGSGDSTVRVWEALSGRTKAIYHGHRERVRNVEWAPYSTYLASASYDGTVQVWRVPWALS